MDLESVTYAQRVRLMLNPNQEDATEMGAADEITATLSESTLRALYEMVQREHQRPIVFTFVKPEGREDDDDCDCDTCAPDDE